MPSKYSNIPTSANDKEFRRALSDWETYVTALTERIIEVDPTVPELPFKDVNFRIYRDIRFSKDPTPYKVQYFSVALTIPYNLYPPLSNTSPPAALRSRLLPHRP